MKIINEEVEGFTFPSNNPRSSIELAAEMCRLNDSPIPEARNFRYRYHVRVFDGGSGRDDHENN